MLQNLKLSPSAQLSEMPSTQAETSVVFDHPRGPDWVHPAIRVYNTEEMGLGLVALDFIPKGSPVILFGGTLMSWREVMELPEDMRDIPFQVADDIFFGIARRQDIGIGERINHSCNPNCGFESEMKLVALRNIMPGEDVTMDYATCSSLENYTLRCRCGEKNCRGVVRGTDWQLPELQERLGRFFQPYLRTKTANSKRGKLFFRFSFWLRKAADLLCPVS